MEKDKRTDSSKKEDLNNNNDKNINDITKNANLPVNNCCLTNDEYIKLFYNSKNSGVNKNFPIKVIRDNYNTKHK